MITRNHPTIHPLNHWLALLCLLLICAWTTAVRANTLYVTSLADSGPGSLRAALGLAADGDTIDWEAPGGTILLTGGELLVTNSVTILAPLNRVVVDGNSAGRVFHVSPGLVVSISGLTIVNGYALNGGGIFSEQSMLTLGNCTLSGNSAILGGGIFNGHSTLTVSNCTLNGNSAVLGGGICNFSFAAGATLVIHHSTLSGNAAGIGGGIFNGASAGGATLAIHNSTLSGNSATAEQGGAIYNYGGFDLSSLDLSSLSSLSLSSLDLSSFSLSGLDLSSLDLRSLNLSSPNLSSLDLKKLSLIKPGRAAVNRGGLNRGTATVKIANSTLSGNSIEATTVTHGGAFSGGAIYNRGRADGSTTLEIGSTILDAGDSGRNIYNQGGTVISGGYNLSSDNGGGFLTATGDQPGVNPLLGPLADNGGSTLTHALYDASPAIDAGFNFAATVTDQRGDGFARTYDNPDVPNVTGGDGTDIGAFEVGEVKNYFPNGVAAGDTTPSSVVLWARAGKVGTVWFEYGTNPTFVMLDGTTNVVVTNSAVPAKVEISGLQEGTQYYYRALFGPSPSSPEALASAANGKFRTHFRDGSHGLRFGVSSCWNAMYKPYVSIRNIPERDLDFFVALGDTVYADWDVGNIDHYREKYQDNLDQMRAPEDNFFALARASTAFYATIDDHEVRNNFCGGAPSTTGDKHDKNYAGKEVKRFFNETKLYKVALQAFHDYWPIREVYYGDTPAANTAYKRKLYRYRTFGKDAAIFMLDARSFRDESVVNGYKEGVSMLSIRQRNELLNDLSEAQRNGITWKFVLIPEPIQNLAVLPANDRFEAYAWERKEVLDYIVQHHIDNVVFISGDIHGTIANDLVYQYSKIGKLQKTKMWDISTGPVGHSALFANLLGVFPKGEHLRVQENDTFRHEINILQGTWPHIGLSETTYDLHPARLLEGQYLSINTFGWTEFEIDPETQNLTVTTWGVYWFCVPEAEHCISAPQDYARIMIRRPYVVSKFRVTSE